MLVGSHVMLAVLTSFTESWSLALVVSDNTVKERPPGSPKYMMCIVSRPLITHAPVRQTYYETCVVKPSCLIG